MGCIKELKRKWTAQSESFRVIYLLSVGLCVCAAQPAAETPEETAGHVGALRIAAAMRRTSKAEADVVLQRRHDDAEFPFCPVAAEKEKSADWILVRLRAGVFGTDRIARRSVRPEDPRGPFQGPEYRQLRRNGRSRTVNLRERRVAAFAGGQQPRGRRLDLRHPPRTGRLQSLRER